MKFLTKEFTDLSSQELYDILQLRAEVFIVEQDCVYQDIDDKDQKALHILGVKNNKIVAYTRVFNAGDYFKTASIGRVVVKETERMFGYGHMIMDTSIMVIKIHFNTFKITVSAQTYLKKFYELHGFRQIGDEYLEDGIPHIEMLKN